MKQRYLLELTGWLAGLAAIIYTLTVLGHGTLALPVQSHDSWATWLQSTDPATIVFAGLRVVALVVALYLFVSTLVLSVAIALHISPLVTVVSKLSAPIARRVAQRALGLSLVGALSMPALASAAVPTTLSADVPTLRHLTPDEPTPTFTTTTSTTAPAPIEPEQTTEKQAPESVAEPVAQTHTHVVMGGENLWGIADIELRASLGREPNTEEVRQYWLKVIESNRTRLSSYDNPSLIFPGQVIELP